MENKIRRYVEGLFEDAPVSRKTVELKEEMIQNLEEKYDDLVFVGKSPEAAYNIVIASIGDVSVLLNQLNNEAAKASPEAAKYRTRSAAFTAVAVMAYILSVLPLIILSELNVPGASSIGLGFMIITVAAATGLLIFNSMSKPKYLKEDDSIIEEFKEWQSGTHEQKQMRKAISSAVWSLVLVVYFLASFTTHAWHLTWIVFPLAGAVEGLINAIFASKKKGGE
ncbi:MAG: permease prefix domain 1-containing protein [Oscillospiraceae bacterium]|nr:permease prefix domain 1-containing protein [Oscillospiraceae bacterium]